MRPSLFFIPMTHSQHNSNLLSIICELVWMVIFITYLLKHMTDLILHDYNGFAVPQRSTDGYVNLTEMAKISTKKVNDYLRLNTTKEYLEELSTVTGIPVTDLIVVKQGGVPEEQGTWAHKLVAIDFAKWISSKFAVWANTHLLQLMETGTTSLANTQPVTPAITTKELIDQAMFAIDAIYADLPIEKALVAGLKLNTVQSISPVLGSHLEHVRQGLINSTAKENQLLTPTKLGKLLNPTMSAQCVNDLLIYKGFQIKNPAKTSRKDLTYLPTDKGKEHCSITLATANGKADTYQQLRWYDSIVSLL